MGNKLALGLAALCACGASSPSTTKTGDDTGGGGDDAPMPIQAGAGPYFEQPMFFNKDVSGEDKATTSDATIAALIAEGGWGNGNKLQIDFSIAVVPAGASTPMKSFTPTDDFYTPDCDLVDMPVPANGHVEGETGYACTGDGDCHLLVYHPGMSKLFEIWGAGIEGGT